MSGNLYQLPTTEDRGAVETMVQVFLATHDDRVRHEMIRACNVLLKKHGLSKMEFANFIVVRNFQGASIRGKQTVTGNKCPGCGVDYRHPDTEARLLSVQGGCGNDNEGVYHYGCRCGAIWRKREEDLGNA